MSEVNAQKNLCDQHGTYGQRPYQSHGTLHGDYSQNTGQSNSNPSLFQSHGTLRASYSQDTGQYNNHSNPFQSHVHASYSKNTGQYNNRSSPSQSHETLDGKYSQNTGQSKNNPSKVNMGNVRMNEQISGFYGQVPTGDNYRRNPSVGQYQPRSDFGQYQQNTNGTHTQVNSHFSHNPNSGMTSAEASETSQYIGTIEELDCLCKNGKVKEAVEVLALLDKQHIPVDLDRYKQLMQACCEAGGLQEAKSIHDHIMRFIQPLEVGVYNKILEMYSKCGSMSDASEVFDKMPEHNLESWETMITWLAKNDLGEEAIDMFYTFKNSGLKPSSQLFIGVLSACGVLGDVNEGILHFESMSRDYGITPSMEHYVSVVHMLGCTGHLDEALEFIENMSLEASVEVWVTLMNLCRIHGHQELGDRCAELVELLDPSRINEQSKAGLVPLKPSDVDKEKGKKKLGGQSLLDVKSRVHEYRAGDTSHPDSDKIYAQLRGMKAQMKECGYIPETRFVLHDVDQESKEEALLSHSERLAISYGLINSPARSTIRVIKNLRVCVDCHNALKIMSKIVGREFIMRDAKRFHHIKDGVCSCRDYW